MGHEARKLTHNTATMLQWPVTDSPHSARKRGGLILSLYISISRNVNNLCTFSHRHGHADVKMYTGC